MSSQGAARYTFYEDHLDHSVENGLDGVGSKK